MYAASAAWHKDRAAKFAKIGNAFLRLLAAGRGRSFLSAFTLRVMPLSDTLEQKRPARRVMPLVLVEYSGLLHASTAAICVE